MTTATLNNPKLSTTIIIDISTSVYLFYSTFSVFLGFGFYCSELLINCMRWLKSCSVHPQQPIVSVLLILSFCSVRYRRELIFILDRIEQWGKSIRRGFPDVVVLFRGNHSTLLDLYLKDIYYFLCTKSIFTSFYFYFKVIWWDRCFTFPIFKVNVFLFQLTVHIYEFLAMILISQDWL